MPVIVTVWAPSSGWGRGWRRVRHSSSEATPDPAVAMPPQPVTPATVTSSAASPAGLRRGRIMAQEKPRLAVVGGGLAGLMATVRIAEAGYPVDVFSLTPPRRSHSVCAQGGINAAVNIKVRKWLVH